MKKFFLIAICLVFLSFSFAQSPININVKNDQPKAAVQPNMWGIFFEDINLAADGGLYAELVKNRSFEFANPMMGWKEIKKGTGSFQILNLGNSKASNPRYLELYHPNNFVSGISNEGFRGMGIKKDLQYHFSVLAKYAKGSTITMRVELVGANGAILGSATIPTGSNTWTKQTVNFVANQTDPKAKLNVWMEGKGTVDLDMISLFPADTWKNRPGGLRTDLVQLLADLKPGFLRFPGGCIVEGRDLANRYQWKKTVGNIEDRELIINRWNTEFANRSTPDYFQSFGLGFYEYFLLSEDLGASPLPILNCGMACQYNTAELVPTDQLDPYIQDALDLIEFANGSPASKWGKLRTAMGHPKPFNLKMLGVGNEQWGPQYVERYRIFAKAIKQKYPAIKLINSVGPGPDDDRFKYLNDTLRKMKADFLDEHYYKSPEWFLQNAKRYDNYDRKGPKIFAGEYAAHSEGIPNGKTKNNWRSALAEAAFMTGLERNADVVTMASYAPLLAHVDGWQWSPDLIWFDNLQAYGTPNYYVQKLFANNNGTNVLPITLNDQEIAGIDSLYASAVIDQKTNEIIIKIANTINKAQAVNFNLNGKIATDTKVQIQTLKANQLNDHNSLEQPKNIFPILQEGQIQQNKIQLELPANSFTVIRFKQ